MWHYVDTPTIKQIYHTRLYPNLKYVILTWGYVKDLLKSITTMQKFL